MRSPADGNSEADLARGKDLANTVFSLHPLGVGILLSAIGVNSRADAKAANLKSGSSEAIRSCNKARGIGARLFVIGLVTKVKLQPGPSKLAVGSGGDVSTHTTDTATFLP